jgi:hypothetical protein
LLGYGRLDGGASGHRLKVGLGDNATIGRHLEVVGSGRGHIARLVIDNVSVIIGIIGVLLGQQEIVGTKPITSVLMHMRAPWRQSDFELKAKLEKRGN